jgi:HAMP domain-containing protein
MNFLRHALAASVLLAPATLFAEPPGGEDEVGRLRERVEEMRRELERAAGEESELTLRAGDALRLAEEHARLAERRAVEMDRARRLAAEDELRMDEERVLRMRLEDERAFRRAGDGEERGRGGEFERRRRMEREGGRPGMVPPPSPVQPPRAAGGGPEDREFELKMRAREIQHQIENLKWELETIELRLQHLRKGGSQARRGPDSMPAPPRIEGPGRDVPNKRGGEMENLKARLQGLVEQLREAEEHGRKDAAEKLRHEVERIKNALQGGEKRPPSAAGPEDRERMAAEIEQIRKKLEANRREGNREAVRELENLLEQRLKGLTKEHGRNVEEKRVALKERAGARIRQLEEKLAIARKEGDRGAVKELIQEIEEVRKMVERELAPEKEQPRKKPRII